MKKFLVYLDDIKNVYKQAVCAESEEKAKEFVNGCGEIVAIKDVTNEWEIGLEKVEEALIQAKFGRIEIDFITQCLKNNGIANYTK